VKGDEKEKEVWKEKGEWEERELELKDLDGSSSRIRIYIPKMDSTSSYPFYFPPLTTMMQLFGIGEMFHLRSLVSFECSKRHNQKRKEKEKETVKEEEKKEEKEVEEVEEKMRKDKFVSGLLNCSFFKCPEFLISEDPYLDDKVKEIIRKSLVIYSKS